MHEIILFKNSSVLFVFVFPSSLQAKCPLFAMGSLAKCLSDLIPCLFGRGRRGQLRGNGARTRGQPQLHRLKAPDDPTITVFIVHILEQVAFTLDCAFHLGNSSASAGGVWVPLLQDVILFPLVDRGFW